MLTSKRSTILAALLLTVWGVGDVLADEPTAEDFVAAVVELGEQIAPTDYGASRWLRNAYAQHDKFLVVQDKAMSTTDGYDCGGQATIAYFYFKKLGFKDVRFHIGQDELKLWPEHFFISVEVEGERHIVDYTPPYYAFMPSTVEELGLRPLLHDTSAKPESPEKVAANSKTSLRPVDNDLLPYSYSEDESGAYVSVAGIEIGTLAKESLRNPAGRIYVFTYTVTIVDDAYFDDNEEFEIATSLEAARTKYPRFTMYAAADVNNLVNALRPLFVNKDTIPDMPPDYFVGAFDYLFTEGHVSLHGKDGMGIGYEEATDDLITINKLKEAKAAIARLMHFLAVQATTLRTSGR